MDKYVPLRQACSFTGLTSQTLRSWAKNDKIKIINTPMDKYCTPREAYKICAVIILILRKNKKLYILESLLKNKKMTYNADTIPYNRISRL